MLRLIKNLKASQNGEMTKGCLSDMCSVHDTNYGPCYSVDLCGIDEANTCYSIDVCYQLDTAGFCYVEDECHVDTVECFAAQDYSGL
jgi:hypothetical protein